MATTLEERVHTLEQQVADLIAQLTGGEKSPTTKDWRSSVGMLPRDEVSEQADRLGREWREQQNDP